MIDNALGDGTRTVTLAVAPGAGYTPGVPAAASVSITDDEPVVAVLATVPVGAERHAGEEPAPAQFALTREGERSAPLTVSYTLIGTAVAGFDYALLSGQVTFASGSDVATVDVTVLDNNRFDGTRTVALELVAAPGYAAAAGATAVVSILDNDALVSVHATDPTASEGLPADPGAFTLTRAGDLSAPLTVAYTLTGSAANGVADSAAPTAVTFAPGAATAVVTVTPVNNSTIDGTRTAVLTLTPGAGYEVGGPATVTVLDNDRVGRRAAAGTAGLGAVKVYDNGSANPTLSFVPFPGYVDGVSVATGDVTGDGVPDVVVGATELSSHVKVFDGATGAELASFLAFVNFNNGVGVAVGDLDNDGRAEVVVGALTAAPHVKVFDLAGGAPAERASFLAFSGSGAGVTVAAGDTDGDGRAEVVVGARVAPHVKTFDLLGNTLRSFLAPGLSGGVAVGAGDLDGDRVAEILVGGAGPGGSVTVFGADGRTRAARLGSPTAPHAVAAADANGDGFDDLLVAVGPQVRTFDGRSLALNNQLAPFPGYLGDLFVG